MIRKRCQNLEQEECQSVDEAMIGYKGTMAGNLRQFNPAKPSARWGFKAFVRAGVTGIVYDFIMYSGKCTFDQENVTQEEMTMGVGAMAVISLCKSMPTPEKSTLTFDNFYSSVPLVTYLKKEMNLISFGTIRKDRLDGCTFSSRAELKKKGRGACESKINKDGVILVRWMDSEPVTLVSNFVGVQPITEVLRYDKKTKEKGYFPCPQIIKVYNGSMGGVDLSDMYFALYKLPSRARRWYFPIFCYLIGISLTNSWLLYKRDCEALGVSQEIETSKKFRLLVCEGLAAGSQAARGRPSLDNSLSKVRVRQPVADRPGDELRTDGLQHWPQITDKGRCRYCQMLCRFICSKCNCRLCLVPDRNCFTQFHCQKKIS
jgi:hypothetical protein